MANTIQLTENQLLDLVKESVNRYLNEYAYHERQNRPQSEEERQAWLSKKAAAKVAYYANKNKDKEKSSKNGSVDYYEYKHGDHPTIPQK